MLNIRPIVEKECSADLLKEIWLTRDMETAKKWAQEFADLYRAKYPKASETITAYI